MKSYSTQLLIVPFIGFYCFNTNLAWSQSQAKPIVRPNPPANYKVSSVKKEFIIPNLPPYPGKPKFLGGFETPDSGNIYQRLETKDKPSSVYAWYSNVLAGGNWKIVKQSGCVLIANDQARDTLTVMIRAQNKLIGGCQICLNYSKYKPIK